MRTLSAGFLVLKRWPPAGLPLLVEGAAAALLIGFGVFPAGGGSATLAAAFPLDVFFDVKHWLAFTPDWTVFVIAVGASAVVRASVLAATVFLADENRGSFLRAWWRAGQLTVRAALFFVPAAALFYSGVAIRYAPFIWVGAALAVFPAVSMVRRAAGLDVGGGSPGLGRIPEVKQLLVYGYVIALLAAAVSVLGAQSRWLAAALVFLAAPAHAAFLLGWRHHLTNGTNPRDGRVAMVLTAVAVLGLLSVSVYDRNFRTIPAVPADSGGSLLLLGGADSTSKSGALTDLDPRSLGFSKKASSLLSYSADGDSYRVVDTRASLDATARVMSEQIAAVDPPADLLGHSQAALILDRLLARGLEAPDSSAQISPPPPLPPRVEAPAPGERGEGKPGADLARILAWVLDRVGLPPFDIDAPASPVHLDRVVVEASDVPRLALWALGDSVWLEDDWRRPGEVNLVVLSDHVGATNNPRALESARAWFQGRPVTSDEASWRAVLVNVYRYAFEPWRP